MSESRCETDKYGTKCWYNENGMLHRIDGPAVEFADGSKWWCVNGMIHRIDGPAIEDAIGYKEWWVDGKLHRTDGPAIEWSDGSKGWWINGVRYTEEKFKKIVRYEQFKQELGELFKI
jgi:hypothetical protein